MDNRLRNWRGAVAVALLAFATGSTAFAQHGHEGHKTDTRPGAGQAALPHSMSEHSHKMMQDAKEDVTAIKAATGSNRERTYLTKMLDHHQSGIDMAKLALEKSKNARILAEARKIIADQTKEIGQMRTHLSSAHQINRTAKPDPRMQPMMEMLQGVSGRAFDAMFVDMMVAHHQGAIDMSRVITPTSVPHRAVAQIASKTIQGNLRSQKALKKAIA